MVLEAGTNGVPAQSLPMSDLGLRSYRARSPQFAHPCSAFFVSPGSSVLS